MTNQSYDKLSTMSFSKITMR